MEGRVSNCACPEGDLMQAIAAGNVEKAKKYFRKLAQARIILS
jgi:hypothetical protein